MSNQYKNSKIDGQCAMKIMCVNVLRKDFELYVNNHYNIIRYSLKVRIMKNFSIRHAYVSRHEMHCANINVETFVSQ